MQDELLELDPFYKYERKDYRMLTIERDLWPDHLLVWRQFFSFGLNFGLFGLICGHLGFVDSLVHGY